TAEQPEKLAHLMRLIEDEVGYALYRAVSGVKAALSRAEEARLEFSHAGFVVDAPIRRTDFEAWIAPELNRIAGAVDAALTDAGMDARAVDRVF
ncbi:hypothetical protein, partial [Klebsiella pneumoniae]